MVVGGRGVKTAGRVATRRLTPTVYSYLLNMPFKSIPIRKFTRVFYARLVVKTPVCACSSLKTRPLFTHSRILRESHGLTKTGHYLLGIPTTGGTWCVGNDILVIYNDCAS